MKGLIAGGLFLLGLVCVLADASPAAGTTPAPTTTAATYDPTVMGQFELLGLSNCVGVQLVAVPGSTNFLLMERPTATHPDGKAFNAGLLDSVTGRFANVGCALSMENCGHSFLANGTVAILAGHKPQSSYKEGRKVTGGDRSARFWCPETYSPSPTSFAEYRAELFVPPFVLDAAHRPAIVSAPTVISYNEVNSITYTIPDAATAVTSVVLVAPSSDTHTFNMHQRLIVLPLLGLDTDANHRAGAEGVKGVTVRGPPDANVAPPGAYMLFLLHGRTYGPGQWVMVRE
ncbi:hypothetical protein TSOC_012972 [Tetrabaena socialis]|uniref:Galactose oxidase-like Early set domain-containing protein n=1 Tax=Tetrabaena socialis TaxID=47790 RepID=A0A2J7ZLL1_9CHLO|nr:hypothetical protein TSOC_012972 [Tetrabaena socialis]|eukprot:PNH01153.1 hypothetical protein TSOC_012972 [Tetrabaena socialis]